MKHGRIIVEGLTDCYFIHQLINVRFCDRFKPIYDDETNSKFRYPTAKVDLDELFRFERKDRPDITLEICGTGGSAKAEVLTGLLRDESGQTRQFFRCVVFDADFPAQGGRDATGNGGVIAARQTFDEVVGKEELFFFPDNNSDGTIETLLKSIANKENSEYFDNCWPSFVDALATAQPKPKRNLSAKTELASYVEAYGKKISERKHQLQNLTNSDLWDYSSPKLNPLIEFLSRFLSKLD